MHRSKGAAFAYGGIVTFLVARALGACVGSDPAFVSPAADAESSADGTASGDASSPSDFALEPTGFDLDPGQTITLKVRGAPTISAIALSVESDPMPDGGAAPATAITLGASSVSLSPSGEATVQVQASPAATQHHFRLIATANGVSRVANGRVAGKPGEFDVFFGDKGGYFDIAPDGDCTAHSVLVQPDGKFVVAGTARGYTALLLARFTADGLLDTTFGPTKAGFVTLGGGRGPQMALLSDGSIAVSAPAFNDPKLFRVSANGIPDPVWNGVDGIDPKLGGGNFVSGPIGKQGDNILVGGKLDDTTAVIKSYLPDAGLDPSFGTSGSASFTLGSLMPGTSPRVEAIAAEPGGTFWVSGQYTSPTGPPYERTYVRRFKANGTSDNVDVSATYEGAATALALQDGKAVVGAFDYPDGNYSMHAFRVSSALDGSFGIGGKTLVAGPPGGFPTSMATDASGRIYIANGAYTVSTFDFYRLTADGVRDTSFGASANGLVRISSGRAYGLAIAGRQLLVVGVNDASDARRLRIARLWL